MSHNFAVGAVGVGMIALGIAAGAVIGARSTTAEQQDAIADELARRAPAPAGGQARLPSADHPTGVEPARIAELLFDRYDHDRDGLIDLRPRTFDGTIRLRGGASLEQIAGWAATDERVANYQGDAGDGGFTLPVQHDLPLLMHAALGSTGGAQADLATLLLRPEQLAAELDARFDTNDDDLLQANELVQFHQQFPSQAANYRAIGELHAGAWNAARAQRTPGT